MFSRKNVDAYNHDEQPCLLGPLKSPNKITSVVFVVEVDEKNISRLCLRVVYLESAQILVFPVDAFVLVVVVIEVFFSPDNDDEQAGRVIPVTLGSGHFASGAQRTLQSHHSMS